MKPMYTAKSAQILFLLFFCSGAFVQIESVKIGKQEWMVKNLDVGRFRNGDLIPEVKGVAEWMAAGEAGKPAWCYFGNNPANGTKYGKLYNWYAVSDPRGLCLTGWHVPSDEEWTQLFVLLGKDVGTKMKSASGWEVYNGRSGNGSNESGFSGIPGAFRSHDGSFTGIGMNGFWWSSSDYVDLSGYAWFSALASDDGDVTRNIYEKNNGFSVRCLRD